MSSTTTISWTNATWNPWSGCTEVSEGCDNCYMMTLKRRWGKDPRIVVRQDRQFREPLKWKEPRMVFPCSMSDFFHKDADAWRPEAWDIIRRTPQHTYQILTKRPGRIHRHLPADWGSGYPNVWLGTTVESQDQVFRAWRIADIDAVVHFVSAEPLLGFIDFTNANGKSALERIDWLIAGGESGPRRRTMDLHAMRSLFEQCRAHDVAWFAKQDSAFLSEQRGRIPDDLWTHEYPRIAA